MTFKTLFSFVPLAIGLAGCGVPPQAEPTQDSVTKASFYPGNLDPGNYPVPAGAKGDDLYNIHITGRYCGYALKRDHRVSPTWYNGLYDCNGTGYCGVAWWCKNGCRENNNYPDDCFPDHPNTVCPTGYGLYCGSGLGPKYRANNLYDCEASGVINEKPCNNGCVYNPNGGDYCR